MSLTGHKSAVSCLRFNKSGALLASGSKDTNIIIWDIVSETGLYKYANTILDRRETNPTHRLRGHKDMVTDCKFLEKSNKLVTSSKDSFMKIWDLETQHCVQTIVTHRNEVWSFDIDDDETRLVTGASDDKIRVWSLVPSEFPNLTSGDEVISSVDTPDLEAYKPDEEEMLVCHLLIYLCNTNLLVIGKIFWRHSSSEQGTSSEGSIPSKKLNFRSPSNRQLN